MDIVFNCINEARYLNHYKKLLKFSDINKELADIKSLESLNSDQIKKLLEYGLIEMQGDSYQTAVPILNPINSKYIAMEITQDVQQAVNKISQWITNIKITLGDKWENLRHNIIIHLVLNYMWQSLWNHGIDSKKGGSIVLVEYPAQCQALYTKLIPLQQGLILVFTQTALQENNYTLNFFFSDIKIKKMLRSMDGNGILLPIGAAELQLLEMKLIKTVRVKGSSVSSYIINTPRVDRKLVQAIRPQLKNLTLFGNDFLQTIKHKLRAIQMNEKVKMQNCHQEDYLQACFYVLNYLIIKFLIDQKVISPFSRVPHVQGLAPRILTTYAIDG